MKTFALKSGDLVVAGGGYGMITGVARVQQQVSLCLREAYGVDRFHPRWGSILPDWIGRTIDASNIQIELRAELVRVVKNFISAQESFISQRAINGQRPVIPPSEVLVDITDIKIVQNQDVIMVKATLRTAGGQEFAILTSPGRTDGFTQ
jgi:hypothetical protein